MKQEFSYIQMRGQLNVVLSKLEDADASDIDRIIALHDEALVLINKLEVELTKITKAVKKPKV